MTDATSGKDGPKDAKFNKMSHFEWLLSYEILRTA